MEHAGELKWSNKEEFWLLDQKTNRTLLIKLIDCK